MIKKVTLTACRQQVYPLCFIRTIASPSRRQVDWSQMTASGKCKQRAPLTSKILKPTVFKINQSSRCLTRRTLMSSAELQDLWAEFREVLGLHCLPTFKLTIRDISTRNTLSFTGEGHKRPVRRTRISKGDKLRLALTLDLKTSRVPRSSLTSLVKYTASRTILKRRQMFKDHGCLWLIPPSLSWTREIQN